MRKTQTRTEDTDTHSGAGWLSPQGDRLLRVLLTHASDAIIVRDAESGVVLDLNGHAETLYGYTHAEVGCFPHGWDPRTDEEQLAGGTKAVGGGAAHTSDQRPRWHRRRDGSVFPAEVTITRLDIDGRSLELATVRDLSEPVAVRSAMEARLVEAEGLLDLASLLERFTNLDHLLDGIVEAAMRFVGADFGAIGYPEGAAVRIARIRDNAGWGGATILLSPEGSGAGDAPHFDLDGVVTVLDFGGDGMPAAAALAEHGVRSLALAPVRGRDGSLVAVLGVGRRYGGLPYDERQRTLLEAAARHAGAALERARAEAEAKALHQETARRAREVELMLQATAALNAALDPDVVVREVAYFAAILCGAEIASVGLARGRETYVLHSGGDGTWVDSASAPDPHREIVEIIFRDAHSYRAAVLPASAMFRTQLSVPLLSADHDVQGVLSLFNAEHGAFTEHDEALISALAGQGAISLERARAREELAQSWTALQRSEERFRSLVQNVSDIITLFGDDGTVRYQSPSIEPVLGYQAAELIGRQVTDLIHPEDRAALQPIVSAPHFSETRPLEIRVRHKDGSWRYIEAVVTNLLTDPSVRAIAVHSRDITERRHAEEVRRFLAEATATLTASLEYNETLKRVAALSVPFLADWCTIHLSDADRDTIRVAAEAQDERLDHLFARLQQRYPVDRGGEHPVALALRTGAPLLIAEVTDAALGSVTVDAEHLRILREIGTRSLIVVPLAGRGRLVGALAFGLTETGRRYNDADLAVAEELARRVSLAIENAQLYGELAERKEQLQVLVGRLLTAHEEERRRVAYEVHDGIAQVAASAHQHLQAFLGHHRPRRPETRQELERAVSLAQRTVREARRVVAGLRPTVLDDFGLATALRQQVEALVAEGWQATYRQDLDGARLLPSMETALFRISQEAIANARKHSRAHRLHLSLTKKRDSLRLLVRDWGRGFDPDLLDGQAAPGERVGLAGMQERVSLLGGTLRITSRPGHGVRVIAEVPLDSATSGASTVRRARRSGDTAG